MLERRRIQGGLSLKVHHGTRLQKHWIRKHADQMAAILGCIMCMMWTSILDLQVKKTKEKDYKKLGFEPRSSRIKFLTLRQLWYRYHSELFCLLMNRKGTNSQVYKSNMGPLIVDTDQSRMKRGRASFDWPLRTVHMLIKVQDVVHLLPL